MPPSMTTLPEAPTFEGRPLPDPTEPVFDQGLTFDVETLLDRRKVLKILGFGAGAFALAACAPGSSASPFGSAAATSAANASGAACTVIPEETAGPFPGDGSNGPDVLTQSGIVRADIRSSFGSSSTVAAGVPLTIRLAIQDLADGCAPLANAAVYVWHCDQQGRYSMYSNGSRTRTTCAASRPPGRTGS